MAGFLRFLIAVALLPACWGAARALVTMTAAVAGLTSGVAAFLGGILTFVALWFVLPHPVRMYVFGHELTHAITGILFGARPSRLRVGVRGGSVCLTKSNLVITLSPYFIPFYTAVVLLAALVTGFFVRPLPWPLAWVFAVGLTWSFHVVFTFASLSQTQPDVEEYGRLFSWTFIFLLNILLVIAALAAVDGMSFGAAARTLWDRVSAAYLSVWTITAKAVSYVS